MTENLNAKIIRKDKLNGSLFVLPQNKLYKLSNMDNSYIIQVDEPGEREIIYVHSILSEKETAIIGKEFFLNFLKDPKRVDLTYIFLSQYNKAVIYLYDMKKTFAGINVILHLIEQWKSSIEDAEYCIKKLNEYELSEIKLGVITEENDIERRKREIGAILNSPKAPSSLASFITSKRSANTSNNIAKAKILEGFLDGKVTIYGHTYKYDIRNFTDKKHDMYFDNGILRD